MSGTVTETTSTTRGLLWLAWRRHRAALTAGGALLLALAGYVLYQRAGMVALLHDRNIAGCRIWQNPCNGMRFAPHDAPSPLRDAYERLDAHRPPLLVTGWLLLAVPVLIGTFVGAPLLARELESGTYKMVWSQSASRTRWLAALLGVPLTAAVAGTTALSALFTWWWWPARDQFAHLDRYATVPFDAVGPAAVALTVLSFFLGAALGLLIARTLPAMAATLAVTAGLLTALGALRPHPRDGGFWWVQWTQAGLCLALAAALAAFCVRRIRRRPV
ncbi:putative transmembrane transport protein [Streptomyces himastatinicus ATCC 53653]|uniref:Putative transmembrane transport protein n=1 Tax=Streptomyces himastatinicus ATCC 53653 TaxID=457427 RepID=D9WAJ4_9ACTN|nr:ABC transporter permease [Streptomyces himastatinicus]EFL26935.1 putative transmembrane transport protein [Streptomyces himastatinicus ATCC 53653]